MSTQLPLVVYDQEYNHHPTRRRICDLPEEERPYYRLHHHGTNALSTTELLALLLGTADALGLAEELLTRFGSLHQLARANKEQLMQIRGIGKAQAGRLMAMLALSCRLQMPASSDRRRVTSPADAANLLIPRLRHLDQEEMHVILLDTRNQVLNVHMIYKGSLNTSIIGYGAEGELGPPAVPFSRRGLFRRRPASDSQSSACQKRPYQEAIPSQRISRFNTGSGH